MADVFPWPLPVAILAGGLGTRLGQLASTTPKALMPVAGQPFAFWQLRLLARAGIRQVVYCVGHLGQQIEAMVGNGKAFGLEVRYSYDGPSLRGTAGALQQALPLLGPVFMVTYGDTYLPCDYSAVAARWHDSRLPALMAVLHNQNQWDASNVVYSDGLIQEYNKKQRHAGMEYVDYGLGILTAPLLEMLPAEASHDLSDLYQQWAAARQLAGHVIPLEQRFHEIGTPAALAATAAFLTQSAQEMP